VLGCHVAPGMKVSWTSSSLSCDARPVALGRQLKARQGWVAQAEPRRFLVSFDVASDSYAAAAGACLTSAAAVPEIESRLGTLEEVRATDELEGFSLGPGAGGGPRPRGPGSPHAG